MALPPEPIEELLARAGMVVDAEVLRILDQGPAPPPLDLPPGHTGGGQTLAAQQVELRVHRVLRGDQGLATLAAHKPEAAYALAPGDSGAFFLAEDGAGLEIVGRYGPDTYSVATIESALARG